MIANRRRDQGLVQRNSGAGPAVEGCSSVTGDLRPTSGLIRSVTSLFGMLLDVVMPVEVLDSCCMRIDAAPLFFCLRAWYLTPGSAPQFRSAFHLPLWYPLI
jgi:hypothetical protein